MAQKVDEAKYEAMISALYTFANNVSTASSEMQSIAAVCVQALSEEDEAVGEIYSRIQDCQQKYEIACTQAKSIAAAMQEELDAQREERQTWSSDD